MRCLPVRDGAVINAPMRQKSFIVPGPGEVTGRKLAYTEFGDAANDKVLVCVHGVSRVGRDFDAIADALSDTYRVICPDMPGRGDSDWLELADDYSYPVYLSDIGALLRHVGGARVDWIGTSMGGLIGMMLAAQAESPIERMVINDIGPVIPMASLQRIGTYLGTDRTFADLAEGEAYLRDVHAPFGPLTDAQWGHLAEHGLKPVGDGTGRVRLHYDPKIAAPFQAGSGDDIVLWKIWDKITCPVLVLHGAESDLLMTETAAEMATRGPKARVETLAGIGHAPALMDAGQIAMVRDWLAQS